MPDEGSGKEVAPSLLVVDDSPGIRKMLVRALEQGGELEVEAAASPREARERLEKRPFDLVVTDITMPEEDGISLMQWGREHHPAVSWIVLTGHGTLNAAVRALQLGAFDFITKPLNMATLRNSVENALNQRRLRAERDRLHQELKESNKRLRQHVEELEEACCLLEEQAETIQADLRRAALIQRALLPQAPPNTPGLSIHALYRPSHTVGGDLYDVVRLDRKHAALLIADAAGHGLSAAMLAVLFRSQLPVVDADTHNPARPSHVLQAANRSLLRGFTTPGLFLTAAYCLVDMADGRVTVASAGHPPLILQRKSGEYERLFHTGPALGLYPEACFAEQQVALEAGDRLVLHSDGLYDRLHRNGGSTSDRVIRGLQEAAAAGAEDEGERLRRLADLVPGGGGEQTLSDDITIVSLCVASTPSAFDNGSPEPVPAPASTAVDEESEILVGGDSRRLTLSISGRASWTQSAAFHQTCVEALELGRSVTLDLTLCQHLDSTLLGTIHELAARADEVQLEFRLQGVTPPVEELFAELGMRRILDHMVPVMLPLPTEMSALACVDRDAHAKRLRILRAHESLAALNERNRREFDPLLEALRKELESLQS